MALTLTATGSVSALAIADSACVEANGTYALIFTGANTVTAAGTYTILGNVITAVTLTAGGSGYAAAPTVATQTGDGSITASWASLATVQDGNVRHPLVEVFSYNAVDDIPFDGSALTSETVNESNPSTIVHSTGRLLTCYIYGPDANTKYILRLAYTDVNRQQFFTADLGSLAAPVILAVGMCELADAKVGIAWIENDAANHLYRLKYRIVTATGTNVSTAEIANWSHDTYTNGLSLIWDAALSAYILVYAKISGSNYSIYKRTSVDFTTWSAEGAQSIGGLTATKKLYSPALMLDTDHATLWLWFSYVESLGSNSEELINVYYTTSADNGATWAPATKFTAYDTYSVIGRYPTSVMKSALIMYAAYTETAKSLRLNSSTSGWVGGSATGQYTISHFDPVRRKLYIAALGNDGQGEYTAVMMVDVDTWTIDKSWSTVSTPALALGMRVSVDNSGDYCVLYQYGSYPILLQVINTDDNTISTYAAGNFPALGITQNVSTINPHPIGWPTTVFYDAEASKIWIMWAAGESNWEVTAGVIDISGNAPHQYTELYHAVGTDDASAMSSAALIDDGYLVFNKAGSVSYEGWVRILGLDGTLIKNYRQSSYPLFPRIGLRCMKIFNGKLYGDVIYTSSYSQENYRGIAEIDLATDEIKFHRPTFATADDYQFTSCVAISATELLFVSSVYGAAIFDTVSLTWTQRSNSTDPGLTSPSSDVFSVVHYDAADDIFFTTIQGNGVFSIPLEGTLKTTRYKIATYSGGAWSWGDPLRMILGGANANAALARWVDGANIYVYALWVNDGKPLLSIHWDVEEPPFDLTPHWIRGTDLTLEWSVDGSFNRLSMELADGHLFDSFNKGSAWRRYVDKGRKLVVRLGELIGGVEYWVSQGTFYVTERKMGGYERGKYPAMSITAEDRRTFWQHKDVIATDIYADDDPDEIIQDLLIDQGMAADASDFDWGAIDNETHLQHQWVETPLLEIVNQIVDRYGYFLAVTVGNDITARKIALNNAVDHTYATSNQLLRLSPDDSFSDFTNQVTVIGQELDFTEVVYAEEQVKSLNGTIGWWGCKNEYQLWYSEDHSRVCRSPRLVVVESVTSIAFALGGDISESITYVDPNEQYCIVTVTAPNLIPQLIAAVAAWAVFHAVPDIVITVGFIASGGFTVRLGTLLQAVALFFVINILGAVGNFQYEIWATPVGYVRRSIQATADDLDAQNAIGCTIGKKIEDPLCYTVADCQAVANHERDVVKAQRSRVAFEKISHLQDEAGDTLSVIHPFSGQRMDVFITDLKRAYRMPDKPAAEEASCIDSIEGWVLP